MFNLNILLFLCVLIRSTYQSTAPTGSVELDELSFDKIVRKFDAALVKFDVAFPYGDKHDAYVALAKDAKDADELLVAEVGVKDYGDKDNEALAKKYGASKDNFPLVKLFIKGNAEPLTFVSANGFTVDELRKFVRENTGIYLSLPGCVKKLDTLAMKFIKSSINDRENIIKELDQIDLSEKEIPSGKIYKTLMAKSLEKGDEFLNKESERVKKLLAGKLSEEKKKELTTRLNILQTFLLSISSANTKNEL